VRDLREREAFAPQSRWLEIGPGPLDGLDDALRLDERLERGARIGEAREARHRPDLTRARSRTRDDRLLLRRRLRLRGARRARGLRLFGGSGRAGFGFFHALHLYAVKSRRSRDGRLEERFAAR
jgi:hypothetical protein